MKSIIWNSFFNIELKIKQSRLQISKVYFFLNFKLIPSNTTIILASVRGIIGELHTDPLLTFIIFYYRDLECLFCINMKEIETI